MDNTLRFIGTVRSTVRDRKEMPSFGAPASVELDPAFADAMLRIEKHSHLWVLAWLMARPERDVLQVVPRGVDPGSPNPLHGVFAVRSPARPNPIGLTAARVLRVDGLRLDFDLLDFLDGTPVIDIKPYFAARDMIFSAASDPVGRPKNRDALRQSLLFQSSRYVPEPHPDVALAVRVMEHYRSEVAAWREPRNWDLELPLARPFFVDAMIGMTRVRLSAGLRLGETVSINGTPYELATTIPPFDEAMQCAERELFQLPPDAH